MKHLVAHCGTRLCKRYMRRERAHVSLALLSTMRSTDRPHGACGKRPRSGSVLVPVQRNVVLRKRKTLERLTYIDLPLENGGIVTDVSEGGLGFHAVAARGKRRARPFLVLRAVRTESQGTGELMWTDGKRKIGGLRFTEFPEEIREQIRNWPLESNLRFKAGKAAAARPSRLRLDLLRFLRLFRDSSEERGRAKRESGDSVPTPPYFPEGLSPEALRGKRNSRLLKTIGISSLAGIFGVVSYFCYREAREWLAASKNSGRAIRRVPRAPQAPAPRLRFRYRSGEQHDWRQVRDSGHGCARRAVEWKA